MPPAAQELHLRATASGASRRRMVPGATSGADFALGPSGSSRPRPAFVTRPPAHCSFAETSPLANVPSAKIESDTDGASNAGYVLGLRH